MGLNTWHNLKLTFSGNLITARVDNTQIAQLTDTTFVYGQVGLGVVGYQTNQFDNLSITPEPSGTVSAALRGVACGTSWLPRGTLSTSSGPAATARCPTPTTRATPAGASIK
ncbi:hypothetical protein [Streptomyces sp. NPDC127036]|uniref:hypothetical protein n=1 Tax=Streptomyces sp. NPDC127036 TaxID=3347112 RepID=UPI003662E01D